MRKRFNNLDSFKRRTKDSAPKIYVKRPIALDTLKLQIRRQKDSQKIHLKILIAPDVSIGLFRSGKRCAKSERIFYYESALQEGMIDDIHDLVVCTYVQFVW